MHMADALLSPAVGATLWAATATATVYCAKKIRDEADPAKVPLMGVTGAFVFSAQMLNFAIPATGSSGHLGGGLLLAILLGPHAAFLVMASVLTVQALFFADGGLLALGANIFNLGFVPAFVAYPLAYKRVVARRLSTARVVTGSMASALVALMIGALCVVTQTVASGVSALPFAAFVALMLPIHMAIGVVEGFATAAVVLFVVRTQPEILERVASNRALSGVVVKRVIAGLGVAALLAAGVFVWFASSNPDGLEWSIEGVTGAPELEAGSATVFGTAARVQERTALLPDYAPKPSRTPPGDDTDEASSWPSVDPGTSAAGLIGGVLTLVIVGLIGLVLSRRSFRAGAPPR